MGTTCLCARSTPKISQTQKFPAKIFAKPPRTFYLPGMTSTQDTIIGLDRKHRAIRGGNRWAVQRLLPDGKWDLVEAWDGNRRSLYHWMEKHGIVPSREAEELLGTLPENTGFRERT
ncbi:MAG: hypothetical protein WC829_04400 [Hyphomicrobium sp.]